MSEYFPGKTAPKGRKILVWGKPKSTQLVKFSTEGWHTVEWDALDQAFCLTGGTWEGPFIKPKFWMHLPAEPVKS